MIKSPEQVKEEPGDIFDHVIDLAFKKYSVKIPKEEIASCYHLKKGGIVLCLWKLGVGSAFQGLVNNIKSNVVNKEHNVYFNFMLTRTRNNLLYAVRQLKKKTNITKFFTDENGNISVKVGDKGKERVTYFFDETANVMRTLTTEELATKYS